MRSAVGIRARLGVDAEDAPFVVAGLGLIALSMAALTFLIGSAALDVWGGLITGLVLVIFSAPALRWVARREGDVSLYRILQWGFLAKLATSMVRYFTIFVVYRGNGDAGVYHEAGIWVSRQIRDGQPVDPIPNMGNFPAETQVIGKVTGAFYLLTSPSAYAGFLAFSAVCFAGQVLMFRAVSAALPEADKRRYAKLVVFLPSLLFWPSSLGKEALMVGCLGLVSFGASLLLAPRPQLRGIGYFAAGIALLSSIRPQIALMSVAALGAAVAVGALAGSRGDGMGAGRGRAVRIVGLVAVAGLAVFASTQFTDKFGSEGGGDDSTTQSTLDATLAATSQGGSEFAPVLIKGPQDLPLGIASVIFRPFPWEARNVYAFIAAAEGLLLMALFWRFRRNVMQFGRSLLRRPFLVFVTAYVVVFSTGFSYFANFGILARQRTQMMPMVLVLLVMTTSTVSVRNRKGAGAPARLSGRAGSLEAPVLGAATAGVRVS